MAKQSVLERDIKYNEACEEKFSDNVGKVMKDNNVLYPRDILKEYVDVSSWNQYSDFDNWMKWTAR